MKISEPMETICTGNSCLSAYQNVFLCTMFQQFRKIKVCVFDEKESVLAIPVFLPCRAAQQNLALWDFFIGPNFVVPFCLSFLTRMVKSVKWASITGRAECEPCTSRRAWLKQEHFVSVKAERPLPSRHVTTIT